MARHDDGEEVRDDARARSRCARAATSSSPSWVLAATQTGRLPIARRKAATSSGSAASGGASNLRLPVTSTVADAEAPIALAVAGGLGEAEVDAGEERAGAAAEALPAAKERSDRRALTRTCGMPTAPSCMIVAGHSSDSTKSASSGRQWSRKRPTKGAMSSGANWWTAPLAAEPLAAILAEVTVTEVKHDGDAGARRSGRISGITALVSPTLAACTQTRRSGRARQRGAAIALAEARRGPPCRGRRGGRG